jgi:hypothetical protein
MIPAQINVGASVPLVREWQGWLVLNITGRVNIKRGGQECPPHHPFLDTFFHALYP